MMAILRGLLGLLVLLVVLFLLSENRRKIEYRVVGAGLLLQVVFVVAILKLPWFASFFEWVSSFFVAVLEFTKQGSSFVFGQLLDVKTSGFIFAFQILPTIIFFSALTSLMFYLGVLQKIVYGLSYLLGKTMKISGAENLSTTANIFLGQTEAPLLIKPYLASMTRSEIFCVMVGGMANTAGGVLAAYVGFLGGDDPAMQLYFAKHLLSASVMSAPATVVVAKMMLPQTNPIETRIDLPKDKFGANFLEAIAIGTQDGLGLALNVAAMLIVFIAFMSMANYLLGQVIGTHWHINESIHAMSHGFYQQLSLQMLLGYLCSPLMWLLGVSTQDMLPMGQLLGEKTILNEFIAYTTLGQFKNTHVFTDPRSLLFATYLLSGFANFASIGIQIGGIGSMAPGQKSLLSQLGLKALIGGTIATMMMATLILMISF